jgi:predicted TIM-barrel fold metal-dependent hydrolase
MWFRYRILHLLNHPHSLYMQKVAKITTVTLFVLIAHLGISQQDKPLDMKMDFEEYDPPSSLKVDEHKLTKAKFPFIDIHNHFYGGMSKEELDKRVKFMDQLNLAVMNNLSGRGFNNSDETIQNSLNTIKQNYPTRFTLFTNIDFTDIDSPDWGQRMAKQVESDVKAGAMGLKIYKNLGIRVTDKSGKRVAVDDPRIDPVWAKCGELGIPVLIHAADPKQFWDPIDKENERWLELKLHPNRRYEDKEVQWQQIIDEQHRMFRKHPKTKFINAHLGWYGNDLKTLSKMMDEMPNMYTEIGAVIAELGRQPRAAKAFLIKYQDRVLFGKDSWVPEEYATYFRVLETEDEYFPYHKRYHAFWRMYGIGLPDDVLKKIYYKNALKLLPKIDASAFPK